ncbi:MAG: AAA family ATPase [Candidatus Hermodarchaeota archaeon]
MINKNFLLILVGLPSSGKTTIAEIIKDLIEKKYKNFQVKIVDPDKIRNSISPNKFNHQKEQLVREKSLKEIRSGLYQGFIVISDDLNYYTSMRHDLKQIAEENNINYFILYIATPLQICIEWNKKRGEPIPQDVIYKIDERFDSFNNYNWDNPIQIIDPSKSDDLEDSISKVINIIERNLRIIPLDSCHKGEKTDKEQYHETLDRITRIVIGNIIKNDNYHPFLKKISKIRKEFIKKNLKKVMTETQISESFLKFIKRYLNTEFP